jgi:hypothetical protein
MKTPPIAPRPTGRPPVAIDIDGYLMPGVQAKPLIVRMHGSQALYAVVFSTIDKLTAFCRDYSMPCEIIKQVTHGRLMLAGLKQGGIRCAIDPHKAADGLMRWLEEGEAN